MNETLLIISLGSAYLELGYSTLSGTEKLVAIKPNKSNCKKDFSQYFDIMTLVLHQFNVIPLFQLRSYCVCQPSGTVGKNTDPEE